MSDSIPASVFNRLAVEKMDHDIDEVSRLTNKFLVERLRELDWDLRIESASMHKVADKVTLTFKLGGGHADKEYDKQWTELELLDLDKLMTAVMGDVLVAAVKDYRSLVAPEGVEPSHQD